MVLPCRWAEGGLPDFAGRVRFGRRFGYPGRIDDFERVWLTVAHVDRSALVTLNGTPLGTCAASTPFEADVTALLGRHNDLTVDVEGDRDGGLSGEVALEVRCLAFLRDVRVDAVKGALQIRGRVTGTADRPLEMYAVLGRRTAAYTTVIPSIAGTPFEMVVDLAGVQEEEPPTSLKIDLVNGASIWYTFEQACDEIARHPQS